ncbi:MAG: hypothetical protein Fur0032_00470 [Terrimicrobiaceae bacterium]
MRFLIIDNDLSAASGLADWFKANGWPTPAVASSGGEAKAWVNQQGGCDIIVCSAELEDMSAAALYPELLSVSPRLKAVFLTNGDPAALKSAFGGCEVLKKPASGEAVDDAIRASFERRSQAETPSVAASPRVAAATPKAAAAPRVIAAPQAVADPKPVATPQPVTGVQATAAPQAVAKPRVPSATAVPQANLSASPQAVPAARAVSATPSASPANPVVAGSPAAPTARAAVKPAAVAKAPGIPTPSFASGETEMAPDDFVGRVLGDYEVEAKIGEARLGAIYRARQISMARPVRLYLLDQALSGDPSAVQRFIANASAKANVNNPNVFAVYEAGEKDGTFFYSCEYQPCSSLAQILESGRRLDELSALRVMKVSADVLGSFAINGTVHDAITARSILIDTHGRTRVANIAASEPLEQLDSAAEMKRLTEIVLGVLDENSAQLGLRPLLESILAGSGPASWPALAQELKALEPRIAPQDAYKLDAQERAAIRVIEETRKRQKRSMIISSMISLSLLIGVLTTVYFTLFRDKGSSFTDFSRMIEIPAGEFVYQDGQKVTLPTFYIDEYEVTIGQYAQFLEWVKANPEEAARLAHEKQPKGKSHVPREWADMEELDPPMPGYYTRARKYGRYQEAPLDMNSPVFGVDWFDAYAYAKWKGRRLPTEQEWEKAARGSSGNKYPWGNEPNHKLVNSGQDLDPNPKKGGEVDGWKRWSPVNAKSTDKSAYGVMGMAGNVSEWTASYDSDPQMPSAQIPVIRGGNWRNPDYTLTRRVLLLTDLQSDNALGFRTVSDTPPSKP